MRRVVTSETPPPDAANVNKFLGPAPPKFTKISISLLPDFVAQIGSLIADEEIRNQSVHEGSKLHEIFQALQLSSSEAVQCTDFLDFASKMPYMFGVMKETKTLVFEESEVEEFSDSDIASDATEINTSMKIYKSRGTTSGALKQIWTAFDPSMADGDFLAEEKGKATTYVWNAECASISITHRVTVERVLVGFVYLRPSQAGVKTLIRESIASAPSCFNIGIALFPAERGWGYAQDALTQALELAFGDLSAHRVQAHVVDGPLKLTPLKMFNKLSFTYEGTQRRALYSPFFASWKDVTTLAVLDTDWMVRQHLLDLETTIPGRKREMWDVMFERQEQERKQLFEKRDASLD